MTMHRLGSLPFWLKTAMPAAGAWLLMVADAQAAAPTANAEGGWPFVGSYAVTVLLVTLGLMVVCQGGQRADEPPLVSRFGE
jgi:hypothetical protein